MRECPVARAKDMPQRFVGRERPARLVETFVKRFVLHGVLKHERPRACGTPGAFP